MGDRYFQGSEIVHAFLVHYAFYTRQDTTQVSARATTAMHDLSSHDAYAHLWLVTQCAQFMLGNEWEGGGGRAEVMKALVRAREIDAHALVRRLTEVVGFVGSDARLGESAAAAL
jgi:hypothetical protein